MNGRPPIRPAPAWRIEDGAWIIVPRTGGMQTKRSFGDMQLHLEFRTPTNDTVPVRDEATAV